MDHDDLEAAEKLDRLRRLVRKAAPGLTRVPPKTHGHEIEPAFIAVVKQLILQLSTQCTQQPNQLRASIRPRTIFQPLRDKDDGSDEQAFLEKLSPFDFRTEHENILAGYSEVRGWFFRSMQYQEWLKGRPWQLCCFGEPRCGKAS